MVEKPKKGETYWVAGHRVYATLRVASVLVKDVYEDDNSVQGVINLAGVPPSYRSPIRQDDDKVETIIHPEELFPTRREAARDLAVQLFHMRYKLEAAEQYLKQQFTAADRADAEKAKDKPCIVQRKKS